MTEEVLVGVMLVAVLSFSLGCFVGADLYRRRLKRESRALDRFIIMEDYRIESSATDGDLIHFECPNGHKASGHLKSFDSMPLCRYCGGLMEPVSFSVAIATPTVANATNKED